MGGKIRTAHEIRRAYLDFFVERGHTEVPGSSLVPQGDPSLLFTSAGMVQFKDLYQQTDNLPYKRATTVQKCLRAGDLDNVGRTRRHHTFFEMLGNFSFGDYFKMEAIRWAWEFSVDLLSLPEDRLLVSIFEEDDEAFGIWNGEIGLSKERIYRLGRKDNFWGPVGETGICGPCSEIYYDNGPDSGCGEKDCAPGCDCDRFIEFWNLVFPQFFMEKDGSYRELEKPGIDTGLGLERLATILQEAPDNYHTDLFNPIIERLVDMIPGGGGRGEENRMSINMIADHARALTFAISEGIYPSNEGRGYLIRRLLRRALTRFYSIGVDKPFLHELVDVIVDIMEVDYPELKGRRSDTAMIIRSEEDNFFRTIEEGKGRFLSMVDEVKKNGSGRIEGKKVFLLYDTFGFPPELTRALAAEEGLGIDEDGFESAMEEQRRKAKEGSSFTETGTESIEMVNVSTGESSQFRGYESSRCKPEIRSFRIVEKSCLEDIPWVSPEGKAVEFIFNETPFYATAGGQVADGGWVEAGGHRFTVHDVFKRGGEIVHLCEPEEHDLDIEGVLDGEKLATVGIDAALRAAIAANHTATHLLHAALRSVIGSHVTQAGSLVNGERLRFDFNHFQAVSASARRQIEDTVNGWIRDSIPVTTELMDYKEAIEKGTIALFGEKYDKRVRVVRVGGISSELCGGTHAGNTGHLGIFLIVSESSVAAGVRRIEALTGIGALEFINTLRARSSDLEKLLKVSAPDVVPKVRSVLDEMDRMKKEIKRIERGGIGSELDRIIESAVDVEGILVASGRMTVKNISALRNQADIFRNKVDRGVAVLSTEVKGKCQFVITVTDNLIESSGLGADMFVRELSEITGGSGGGKKHLAQLGTKETGCENDVFNVLPGIVKRLVTN